MALIDFSQTNNISVLTEALRLTNYATVCAGVLAQTDASEYPDATKQAIGRLGERMATFNGGNPHAAVILHTIATIGWEDAGISGVPALTTADRAALIDIVMGVCKGIITAESDRLSDLAASDTALPEGWDTDTGTPTTDAKKAKN